MVTRYVVIDAAFSAPASTRALTLRRGAGFTANESGLLETAPEGVSPCARAAMLYVSGVASMSTLNVMSTSYLPVAPACADGAPMSQKPHCGWADPTRASSGCVRALPSSVMPLVDL